VTRVPALSLVDWRSRLWVLTTMKCRQAERRRRCCSAAVSVASIFLSSSSDNNNNNNNDDNNDNVSGTISGRDALRCVVCGWPSCRPSEHWTTAPRRAAVTGTEEWSQSTAQSASQLYDPNSTLYFDLLWICPTTSRTMQSCTRAVGTGPADPAAAGPIV